MAILSQKHSGAYYTPEPVVANLVRWAVRKESDRLLDPSCGDGRFIAAHQNSFGVEQDPAAVRVAMRRAPKGVVHEGDFFAWAASSHERFECAAGNPPFIRYQTFKGEIRARALQLCASLGVKFSGLTASWAPFLVATANMLKPDGRMAFVVPAAIGHAPYAAPLLEYLVRRFSTVRISAIRRKLFPQLSEDCWLLYASGFGGRTDELHFSVCDRFVPSASPPRDGTRVSVHEWRDSWNRRLRPYLLPRSARELYTAAGSGPDAVRFGDIATIGIGYVSGANEFFHLRPSQAEEWSIPSTLLHPTVRNGRVLPAKQLTMRTIEQWWQSDDPMMLLRIPKRGRLPLGVTKYLDTDRGRRARAAYKCRMREPWYSVPDVQVPDFFLTYMSGRMPNLVRNAAGATCTNAVHSIRARDKAAVRRLVEYWDQPFLRLSCELEGHPLGGGMLKLEPREATQILFPPASMEFALSSPEILEAVSTMLSWRHYAAKG